jgi:hypothetical protein
MKTIRWFCSLAACAPLACASPHPIVVTAPVSHEPRTATEFTAGVARVDITPPPGVSTFAYAPEAAVTNGYWSRLYCRVFVLKPAIGTPVAIVPCDLTAVSAALHHRVADKVKEILPRSRIMITASHTPAGPAHYFESSALAGESHPDATGFDPAMLEMLAARIAEGIEHANNRQRPARLRWSFAEVHRLTRNKSVTAYLANSPNFSSTHPVNLGPQSSEEERAIDPMIAVLQLEETSAESHNPLGPLGWLVFAPMQPAAMRPPHHLLSADVFGVAARALEARLRPLRTQSDPRCKATSPRGVQCPNLADFDPLVGIISTNAADVVPNAFIGSAEEVMSIGNRFAERLFSANHSRANFSDKVVIDTRYLEADLPGACLLHGASLCAAGELGNGLVRGGNGSEPIDNERDNCQAPKPATPSWLNSLMLGGQSARFPEHVAFGLVRIDDTWVSFVPAQVTVHAGWAIRQRVEHVVQTKEKAPQHYLVASLANAYVETIASRAEYNLQFREGAATLYGPQSAEYTAERVEILARSMLGQEADKWLANGQPPIDAIVQVPFEFGPKRERLARPSGPELVRMVGRDGLDLCRIRLASEQDAICFQWRDGSPGRVTLSNPDSEPWVELLNADQEVMPSCSLRGKALECDPVASIDDRGLDFQTRVLGRDGDGYLWSTLFRPSPSEWPYLKQAGKIRFRVRGDARAAAVLSPAFFITELPLCSDKLLRRCVSQ